jgi:hypothetical protein
MNYIIFCLQALSLGIRYVDTAPWQRGKNISPRDVGCHHDLIEMVRRIHVGSQNLIAHSSNLGNSLISRLCADVGDDLIVVDFLGVNDVSVQSLTAAVVPHLGMFWRSMCDVS